MSFNIEHLKSTLKGDPITIRLSLAHEERLQKIQCNLNISRNKLIDVLLDASLADLETQLDFM